MKRKNKEDLLKWANACAYEATWAASKWREDSWRACELYDGGESAWTQEDWNNAQEAGVEPISTARIFSAVNKLIGSQIIGRFEIIAKGRTQKDGEISQVMSEGIKFVMDQHEGEFVISHAHSDALIPGIGWVSPCFDADPRKERVALKYRDWKSVWWDPYSSPWIRPERTRYVFQQPWVDLDDFQALFPEKRKEIQNAYDEVSGQWREHGYAALFDEAQQVEEEIRMLSASDWVDVERKRIRPIEMWYPVNELSLFALFPDGRCYEIRKDTDPVEAFQMIANSQQVLRAIVKKMRTMTFFGEHLLLQDIPSPYAHDQFPYVPFLGYIDRWGFPYGVPRQAEGLLQEADKRRSMALAMLQKRRVMVERDAVGPDGDQDKLDALYEEANKLDGFMVLGPGGLNKFKIDDLAQLSQFQLQLLQQTEYDIRDLTGADSPLFSGEKAQSGISKQMDAQKSGMTTASLQDNLRRSMNLIGNQLVANIQSSWRYEKVLRVTDRLTGAERFVTVNQPLGPGMEVRNNITQGKHDIVVSEVPATDTMREKNLDLLMSAIQKSPPEAVPTLLISAFELSDLPNKDLLLEKLKPVLGIAPEDEDMSAEEKKQQTLKELQAQKEQMAMQQQLQMEGVKLELNQKRVENAKIEAEIAKIIAEAKKTATDTVIAAEEHEIEKGRAVIEGVERGLGISERMNGEGEEKEKKDAASGKN